MATDKEKKQAVDSAIKSFLKSQAGVELIEHLELMSRNCIKAAQSGIGVTMSDGKPVEVQLSEAQQLGMLQRSVAYDGTIEYLKRRANI